MAQNPGHSTSTNQDRDTGMAPNQSTEPDRGQADEGETQRQAADHPAKRDGGEARRRSRLDPETSGMPDPGDA